MPSTPRKLAPVATFPNPSAQMVDQVLRGGPCLAFLTSPAAAQATHSPAVLARGKPAAAPGPVALHHLEEGVARARIQRVSRPELNGLLVKVVGQLDNGRFAVEVEARELLGRRAERIRVRCANVSGSLFG